MTGTLTVHVKSKAPYNAPLAYAVHLESLGAAVEVVFDEEAARETPASYSSASAKATQTVDILQALAQLARQPWNEQIKGRADQAEKEVAPVKDFGQLEQVCNDLDDTLTLRSFFVGYELTAADFAMWSALKGNNVATGILKKGAHPHLNRWLAYVDSREYVKSAVANYQDLSRGKGKAKAATAKGATASKVNATFELGLEHAEKGKVVTRFPPEPSGYLHIGHAKAAILNSYFAQHYEGRFLVRFDDTNPTKEKAEFEESIKEDLELLGIRGDTVTYTSDYFEQIYDLALKLIKEGNAYCDDTLQEQMRDERMKGIASGRRDATVEENLARFAEMRKGSEEGQRWCLRAKISFTDLNKAMRDPVIYRCNVEPHHRTGSQWKVYPTYDFACPVVDSLEGVTHALRTNEYRDRNPQYAWMQNAAGLRTVHIWDFGRINFVYTLLSKRKLKAMAEETSLLNDQAEPLVRGWDDPRFPTVRGIRRRGMTIPALRQYMLEQGPSQAQTSLEWDKIWATNKQLIDPIAPRHVAVVKKQAVTINVAGDEAKEVKSEKRAKHKKNAELGDKTTWFGPEVIIDQEDAKTFADGEEITLMDWGNAILKGKHEADSTITSFDADLNLAGDFKKTSHKVTWLEASHTCDVVLLDYDYLITKKKLEDTDDWTEFINPKTEFATPAFADVNVASLPAGEIIQFERKGYYIVDKPKGQPSRRGGKADEVELISIPDGRTATVALKATPPVGKLAKSAVKSAAAKVKEVVAPSA